MKTFNFDNIFAPLLKNMNAEKVIFHTNNQWHTNYDNLKIELQKPEGIEVDISDLDILGSGVLANNGNVVLVYIRDAYPNQEPKFHISDCRTIQEFRKNGNLNKRFVNTQNTSGKFLIKRESILKKGVYNEKFEELKVCKNCLKKLNYKNLNDVSLIERNQIYRGFSIQTFLEEYDPSFSVLPKYTEHTKPYNTYTESWEDISRNYRESKNYTCEKCGINFSGHKDWLHTHHIDGDKTNNSIENLKALCKWCHSKEPGHEHMRI
jgi:hypothetical protein